MRSAVLDLAWYQYFLLDVIAVLGLVGVCSRYQVVCQYATSNYKCCKEERLKNIKFYILLHVIVKVIFITIHLKLINDVELIILIDFGLIFAQG